TASNPARRNERSGRHRSRPGRGQGRPRGLVRARSSRTRLYAGLALVMAGGQAHPRCESGGRTAGVPARLPHARSGGPSRAGGRPGPVAAHALAHPIGKVPPIALVLLLTGPGTARRRSRPAAPPAPAAAPPPPTPDARARPQPASAAAPRRTAH